MFCYFIFFIEKYYEIVHTFSSNKIQAQSSSEQGSSGELNIDLSCTQHQKPPDSNEEPEIFEPEGMGRG